MRRMRDDSGLALATILVAILMLTMFTALLLREAITQREQSAFQAREDVVVAGAEAMLERYASKLTVDPLYYLHWVDEAERARVCATAGHPQVGTVVQPGNAWPWDDCYQWTYQNPVDWYVHPILDGTVAASRDDVGVLMEVSPPVGGPIEVLVAGKRGDWVHRRAISATIQATALSEFYRVTENNLNYGANRTTRGKVYSGGHITYGANGHAYDNIYAEDKITAPPTFHDDAEGYESDPAPPPGGYNDIRDALPQPLDFNDFWDDLEVLKSAASSGGLYLDDADAEGWRIHAYVDNVTGEGKLEVCKNTNNHNEVWWWTEGSDSEWDSASCTIEDIPLNGAVWANAHVVVGDRDFTGGHDDNRIGPDAFSESILKGSMTIYAGTVADKKNLILNADTIYDDPNSLSILGLIASDEVIINGTSTGNDKEFRINAALLGQYNKWVAHGLTPSGSTLRTWGSIATRDTGAISGAFPYAEYGFDPRFAYLRPPFFPLLVNDWSYEDWTELPLPDWAKP